MPHLALLRSACFAWLGSARLRAAWLYCAAPALLCLTTLGWAMRCFALPALLHLAGLRFAKLGSLSLLRLASLCYAALRCAKLCIACFATLCRTLSGSARLCWAPPALLHLATHSLTRLGCAFMRSAWLGSAWLCLLRLARLGIARLGSAPQCPASPAALSFGWYRPPHQRGRRPSPFRTSSSNRGGQRRYPPDGPCGTAG